MTDESWKKKSARQIFDLLVLKGENAYAEMGLLPILWTLYYMN